MKYIAHTRYEIQIKPNNHTIKSVQSACQLQVPKAKEKSGIKMRFKN